MKGPIWRAVRFTLVCPADGEPKNPHPEVAGYRVQSEKMNKARWVAALGWFSNSGFWLLNFGCRLPRCPCWGEKIKRKRKEKDPGGGEVERIDLNPLGVS